MEKAVSNMFFFPNRRKQQGFLLQTNIDWVILKKNVSSEKKPGWLSLYRAWKILYSYIWGLFHKPWNEDPVIKQPGCLMDFG